MSFGTSRGNRGFTDLLGRRRVPKYHLRTETYGTLDELNSFLGMARAITKDEKVKKVLFTIQNHFFMISSALALPDKDREPVRGGITKKEVDWLRGLCIDIETLLKPNRQFIIYGETQISSILYVARAVSRRAERLVAKMKSRKMLTNLKILEYLNLLSDVLYLLGRYEEKRAGVKPKHPSYESTTEKGNIFNLGLKKGSH